MDRRCHEPSCTIHINHSTFSFPAIFLVLLLHLVTCYCFSVVTLNCPVAQDILSGIYPAHLFSLPHFPGEVVDLLSGRRGCSPESCVKFPVSCCDSTRPALLQFTHFPSPSVTRLSPNTRRWSQI